MAADVLGPLRGLFGDGKTDEPVLQRVSRAVEKLTEARRALERELSGAIEQLSEEVDRCLERQLLHLEWEERFRQARALDAGDRAGLVRQAARESELHRERVEEHRAAADRQEAVVRALEQRRVEIDRYLERILRERDVARTAEGLARGRERIVSALSVLGKATGLDFLEALDELRRRSEDELALAQARDELEAEALQRRK